MALEQIQHIVVVMMENRSFDMMLGHLSLDGMGDVAGLTGPEVNFNVGPGGEHIGITAFHADGVRVQRHGEALQKRLDPDHSKKGVRVQLGKGYGTVPNGGFVKAFIDTRKPEDEVGEDLWIVPMGYYTAQDLPTYSFLAHEFCVCDAWHASVPGDTWPNRLFAVAGQEGPKVLPSLLDRLSHLLPDPLKRLSQLLAGPIKAIGNAPIYDVPAFTRHLKDEQWKWYSHDPATLRAIDSRYRDFRHIKRDNFAFFDRKQVSLLTETAEAAIVGHDSFLDDAAKGNLRDVSWIDPNFIDLSILDPNSNDDHPPSDVRAGQEFVLEVYEALSRGPAWNDTMLVVVYDEHGGFYDHVVPPPIDDDTGYKTLGVRVPALVVGPRVKRFVCHETFDHTTLINTILTRFAPEPEAALAQMSQRVRHARDLSGVLQPKVRTNIASHVPARKAIDTWRAAAREARRAAPGGTGSPAPDGAGRPLVAHDFQDEFARFAHAMREAGLPHGQP
jgi:phospholipase C